MLAVAGGVSGEGEDPFASSSVQAGEPFGDDPFLSATSTLAAPDAHDPFATPATLPVTGDFFATPAATTTMGAADAGSPADPEKLVARRSATDVTASPHVVAPVDVATLLPVNLPEAKPDTALLGRIKERLREQDVRLWLLPYSNAAGDSGIDDAMVARFAEGIGEAGASIAASGDPVL